MLFIFYVRFSCIVCLVDMQTFLCVFRLCPLHPNDPSLHLFHIWHGWCMCFFVALTKTMYNRALLPLFKAKISSILENRSFVFFWWKAKVFTFKAKELIIWCWRVSILRFTPPNRNARLPWMTNALSVSQSLHLEWNINSEERSRKKVKFFCWWNFHFFLNCLKTFAFFSLNFRSLSFLTRLKKIYKDLF